MHCKIMSNEPFPAIHDSNGCINILSTWYWFVFWTGFSRKVEGGWGGPESLTERLWDIQESASGDGELRSWHLSAILKAKMGDTWQYVSSTVNLDYVWAEGCTVVVIEGFVGIGCTGRDTAEVTEQCGAGGDTLEGEVGAVTGWSQRGL